MPILQRYSNIKNGGIVLIGNTLGLSKAANTNTAGTRGSIGAFISRNLTLKVNDFPSGTTLDYTKNGSAAQLALPSGSSVLYAELIWGGLFRSTAGNISALLENAVSFQTPLGQNSVLPDVQTRQNFNITNSGVTVGFYVRSANVTALVRSAMNGEYAAGGIPSLIEAIDARTTETNHAGWTLAVVYENEALPLRNLTLWCGGTVVSPSEGSTDVTLTGFVTPDLQPVTGKLFVSAQEGDAVITGDRMLFGKNTASLTALSGPNNPANNFFASQINGESGVLAPGSTFADRNANAAAGTNTIACRQGWDITAVNISSLLTPGMTTAAVRFTTDGDLYVPNCLGLQIDSKGARLQITKAAEKSFAAVGESVGYTLHIVNTGSQRAETVSVSDFLPSGGQLVPGSVTLNGAPYAGGLPVSFGPLEAGASADIAYSLVADTLPVVNPMVNLAKADYMFMPFPGYPVNSTSFSNLAGVYIVKPLASLSKSADKAFATAGEELFYTSLFKNEGNLPVTDIDFRDPIPVGTAFVQGSVSVDGVSQPAYDPSVGFSLPGLAPGGSTAVTFRVKINATGEIPMIIQNQSNVTFKYIRPDQSVVSGDQDSNIVKTEILTYAVTRVKSSDKAALGEGENARQKVVVTNNSAALLREVSFQDAMSPEATYVPGSVSVNGVAQPAYDPYAGFVLSDIPSGGNATVEYSILSNNPKTGDVVTNRGSLNYTVDDPVRGPVSYLEETNLIAIPLYSARISVKKSVDKGYATAGEKLRYTSVVTNTGSLNQTDLQFKDAIPAGTSFVAGSVKIDGVSYPAYDPSVGFALGNLAAGASVTVEFEVTVL